MPFTNHTLMLLYLKNLQESNLESSIVSLEQGETTAWTAITSIDALQTKVKATLKAYASLRQSSNRDTPQDRSDRSQSTPSSSDKSNSEYTKHIKRVIGGLRSNDKDKITAHIKSVLKWKQGGCFIHDHQEHTQASCKKLKSLCEQFSCTASLTAAIASSGSNTSGSNLTARRAQAQLKKDCDDFEKDREDMKKQNEEMQEQMKTNNDLMKALKVTMQSQTIARGIMANSINPFQHLDMDTDDEADEGDGDDANPDDAMNEAVDTTDNNNDDVTSYTHSYSIPVVPNTSTISHTILARCKKLTVKPLEGYTVVDSGATVHMDNDRTAFEYIVPVTDDNDQPLYV